MRIEDLMDLEMYGSMYILFAMASFYVEGANLLVPSRVNFNFKRILSPFTSFFKGFIGAGGWAAMALRSSGLEGKREQLNDGASDFLRCPVSFHDFAWKGTPRGEWI
ncbi:MAG: hypothetical protein LKE16_05375 [Dialister sp.]|nr:hypothetical protein [Dialister sp.]